MQFEPPSQMLPFLIQTIAGSHSSFARELSVSTATIATCQSQIEIVIVCTSFSLLGSPGTLTQLLPGVRTRLSVLTSRFSFRGMQRPIQVMELVGVANHPDRADPALVDADG